MDTRQTRWASRATQFLAGQTVSMFGSMVVQYVISWHVTLTTQSGTMLTIATLCGFLPQLLVSLFAGVWADRYNRKMLIMLSDGMIAVCTLGLAIALSLGYDALWLLFFISAVRSLGSGIQMPAVGAFLPEIVPEDKLLRVNGINASIQGVMMLIAPAAAGWVYAEMGLAPSFWIDVVTAVIGIGLLAALHVDKRVVETHEQPHIFEDMGRGIRYVAGTKWLTQFLLFYLFFALMFGPVVFLTPLMVARSFGPEPWRLMAHEIVFAAGAAAGGMLAGFVGARFKNMMYMLIIGCVAFGVTTLVMGFSPNFWFYLGVMLPMGITMPLINTGSMTILQTRVQPDMMGRVFGLSSIISSSAMPLSMVFFGPLADRMSVESQLIITGILMVAISLLMLRAKACIAIGVAPTEAAGPTPEA